MSPLRATYQFSASACALLVSRVPALEPALVRVGSRVWKWRGAGHFYRSVAGRYADRLRQSGSPFRSVMIGDIPLIVDVTDFTTSSLYFGNIAYEPDTTGYLCRHLGPGSVFVDVGANHGYFTLLGAGLVGDRGRVFAFEPNPPVYEQLRTHVRVNGFDARVSLMQQALWDTTGEQDLFVSQWSWNSGVSTLTPSPLTIAEGALSPERTIPVRTETFDHWLDTSGVERVDLMKVDAEGAEDHVVRGMSGALQARRIRRIVCETEWNSGAHQMLCGFGLAPHALDRSGHLTNIAYELPE